MFEIQFSSGRKYQPSTLTELFQELRASGAVRKASLETSSGEKLFLLRDGTHFYLSEDGNTVLRQGHNID